MAVARSRHSPGRLWLVIALALLVILETTPPVCAWGPLGHRVIARLAERNLNPKAKRAVAALLDLSAAKLSQKDLDRIATLIEEARGEARKEGV